MPCDLCSHFKEKFKSKTDGNNLNQRSGDWKCDEELEKKSLKCIVQDPPITEWKWKNPYSVSDFDRSKRWYRRSFTSGKFIVTPRHELKLKTHLRKKIIFNWTNISMY